MTLRGGRRQEIEAQEHHDAGPADASLLAPFANQPVDGRERRPPAPAAGPAPREHRLRVDRQQGRPAQIEIPPAAATSLGSALIAAATRTLSATSAGSSPAASTSTASPTAATGAFAQGERHFLS